jgi:hypothetical protein
LTECAHNARLRADEPLHFSEPHDVDSIHIHILTATAAPHATRLTHVVD